MSSGCIFEGIADDVLPFPWIWKYAFVLGNFYAVLLLFAYIWGSRLTRPYRQPYRGILLYALSLVMLIIQLWRPLYTFFDLIEAVFFACLPLSTNVIFFFIHMGVLPKLRPLEHSVALQRECAQVRRSTAFRCGRTSKSEGLVARQNQALVHELAFYVEELSRLCVLHPAILALRYRKRVASVRCDIERLLHVVCAYGSLDFALLRVNVPRLLAFGGREAVSLLRVQTPALSRDSKAVLVDALQKTSFLRSGSFEQEWLVDLFTTCFGSDLVMLKNTIDGGGDYHSLRKLIYVDLTSERLRQEILDHFKREASYEADIKSMSPERISEEGSPEDLQLPSPSIFLRKVLSDIDDTLYCSGGHFPAGVDKRFPKYTVYPGLLQLYKELDAQWRIQSLLSGSNISKAKQGQQLQAHACNLVFLSARPHIYKDVSEKLSYQLFKQLLAEGELHAMPTLVPGRAVPSLKSAMLAFLGRSNAWQGVAMQKFQSIRDFKELYPNYYFLFFGDNGQGDLLAAEHAMRAKPPLIQAAFIHQVQPLGQCLTSLGHLPEGQREKAWDDMGIYFFRTPVEAGIRARRLGLISAEGLRRTCASAVEGMEAIVLSAKNFKLGVDGISELNHFLQEASELVADVELIDVEAINLVLRRLNEAPCGHAPSGLESLVGARVSQQLCRIIGQDDAQSSRRSVQTTMRPLIEDKVL